MSTSGSGGNQPKEQDEPSVTLQLTDRQKRLLVEMVGHYSEGIRDAITHTTNDRSLGSVNDLLELTGGYANALFDLEEMEKQLS